MAKGRNAPSEGRMPEMKRKVLKLYRKVSGLLLCVFVLCASFLALAACSPDEGSSASGSGGSSGQETPPGDQTDGLTMLKTDGEFIRDENGTGDVVWLRGVNAGGLGVIEQWMTGFAESSGTVGEGEEQTEITCIDHITTSRVFIARFGFEKAEALWKAYQADWWTDADFQNCADMGMTCIRLPFTYMNVDFAAVQGLEYAGKSYDFTMLDEFVAKAAEYGMYTILDLHGAYGSQNGQDHSGQVLAAADVDFYSNEQKMSLTVDLWRAVAEHFQDNPNVAAYDILNEPGERNEGSGTQSTTVRHWIFMDRAYDAIREVDQDHIVVFESCWEGNNLPQPSEYGWENCMYSFHHYSGAEHDTAAHATSVEKKIENVAAQNFGIPVQMGEFTCYNLEESWEYTLDALNRNNWHWVSWTYKINNAWTDSAWGIYHIDYSENGWENYEATANSYKVNAHTDSEEEILRKWERTRTAEHGEKYTFSSGTTLYDIVKKYCTQSLETAGTEPAEVADGNYLAFDMEGDNAGLADGGTLGGRTVLAVESGFTDAVEIVNVGAGVNIRLGGETMGVFRYGGVFYVGATDDPAAALFYPLETSDGNVVFLSAKTRRYLACEEGTGYVRADALTLADALKLRLRSR